MRTSLPSRCEQLAHPNYYAATLAFLLLIGIVVSYLPQHYKIIHRRTSRGLNPFFLLLGTISGIAGLANILTAPLSQTDFRCCRQISHGACAVALLGIGQVGAQFVCFFVILLLWLIFFPRGEKEQGSTGWDTWYEAVIVGIVSMITFLVVSAIGLWFTVANRKHLSALANTLGVLGALTAAIQYLPQIWTTARAKQVQSLSIPMMCIQTPGSALWAFSLFLRFGWAGWSTWGIYLLTGSLQCILLFIAIRYRNNDPNIAEIEYNERSDASQPSNERTQLLQGQRSDG